MNTKDLEFRFSDPDLAKSLIDATPPEGVRVSGSTQPVIRASEGADIVFTVTLHITHHIELLIVAAWMFRELLPHIKKRGDPKTRVNNEELLLIESEIVRLMRDQIHWQQVRDAERKEGNEQNRLEDKASSE